MFIYILYHLYQSLSTIRMGKSCSVFCIPVLSSSAGNGFGIVMALLIGSVACILAGRNITGPYAPYFVVLLEVPNVRTNVEQTLLGG